MSSRFIQLAPCATICSLFKANLPLYLYFMFCLRIHPLMDTGLCPHLGYCEQCCCEHWCVKEITTKDFAVTSFGYLLQSGAAGSCGMSVSDFMRNLHIHPSLGSNCYDMRLAAGLPSTFQRSPGRMLRGLPDPAFWGEAFWTHGRSPILLIPFVGLALAVRENSDPSHMFSLGQEAASLTLISLSRYHLAFTSPSSGEKHQTFSLGKSFCGISLSGGTHPARDPAFL